MSTFHGLEMAKRALAAQQAALYTTGHNISNANTEGYTRQRVNLETLPGYPSASRNAPKLAGQLGQGVEAASVERIRDSFLDNQYRTENGEASYWETKSNALRQIESIFNEPSDSGLSTVMNDFWQSLQDLAVNPDNDGVQAVVVQRGKAVAETFKNIIGDYDQLQKGITQEIEALENNANSLIKNIDSLNNKIYELESAGLVPNDLYDERDRLVDNLSGIVDIKVTRSNAGDHVNKNAAGMVAIELLGETSSGPVYLVKPGNDPQQISVVDNEIRVGNDNGVAISQKTGSLQSLIDVHGKSGDNSISIEYLREEISKLATDLATKFNNVLGDQDFFAKDGLSVVLDNPNVIDGEKAKDLAGTINMDDYQKLVGELGATAQDANRMTDYTNTLKSQIENQRLSISSVSLDEEMTNMIKFQHAYNAAARSMTAMDEMLDRIINNMGIVGR